MATVKCNSLHFFANAFWEGQLAINIKCAVLKIVENFPLLFNVDNGRRGQLSNAFIKHLRKMKQNNCYTVSSFFYVSENRNLQNIRILF